MIKRLTYCLLVVLTCLACRELKDLHDDVSIQSFNVLEIYTENVRLGQPVVQGDFIVNIPLEYGKYNFPIAFKAEIVLNATAMKLCGINPDTLVFRTLEEMKTFFVVAENGKAQQYKIVLTPSKSSDAADIEKFTIYSYSPRNAFVSSEGYVSVADSTVKIIMPEVTLPLTVMPNIVVSDSAYLANGYWENGLEFTTLDTAHYITVVAVDGRQKKWRVVLEQGRLITDNASLTPLRLKAVNLDASSTFGQLDEASLAKAQMENVEVDTDKNWLIGILKSKSSSGWLDFPFKVAFQTQLPPMSEIIGYLPGSFLQIDSPDKDYHFYVYDRARNNTKKWQIKLLDWTYHQADVTAFTLLRSSPSTVKLDVNTIDVDVRSGSINIRVMSGGENFPLSIAASMEVMPNATLKDFTNGGVFTFSTIDAVCPFKVVAMDGTEKSWYVRLMRSGELNNEADVEFLRVKSYSSVENKVVLNPIAVVDKVAKTVNIEVLDWSKNFPLNLKADLGISYNAQITNGAFTPDDMLSFPSINSTHTVTLKSEDGTVTNSYTIRFVNKETPKSDAAELLTFSVANLSEGYTLSETEIDQSAKTVTLKFLTKGVGRLDFTPYFTISPRAEIEELISGFPLIFGTIASEKKFTIISESERVSSEWTIKAKYEPQLYNGDLEQWTDDYTPVGWATANNSFAKMTSKAVGNGGGWAAKLTTGTIMDKVAAGSLFLGYFKMNLDYINTPKKMTFFGIPFSESPKAVALDVKYTLNGTSDRGSVGIELLNYSGEGDIVYHTLNEPDVTVLACGNLEIAPCEWRRIIVPLTVLRTDLPVTHIHCVFSSSYKGDFMQGVVGATLYVDNIKLIY